MAVNLSPFAGVGAQLFDNNGNVLAGGKIYSYAAGTNTPATVYTNSSGTIAQSNPIILDASGRVPGGEIWLTDGIAYKFVVNDAYGNLIATYDNLSGINSNFVAYTSQQEIQTATAGQTVFTLTTMQYQPGTNNLSVFVDGVNQYGPGAQYAYVETSANTVTFENGLHVGALVKFTTASPVASAVTNATNVSYLPPFAGGVAETLSAKLAQTISVLDFGADPTGANDSSLAIASAISSMPTSGGTIYFPSGTYKCNIVVNKNNIRLIGYGANLIANSTGPTIKVYLLNNTIANVNIEGFQLTGNNQDIVGIQIVRSTKIVVNDCTINGYNNHGVQITGDGTGSVTQIVVQNSKITAGASPDSGAAGISIGGAGVATTVRLFNNYITNYVTGIADGGVNTVGLGNIIEYATTGISTGAAGVYIGDWMENETITGPQFSITDQRVTIFAPHPTTINDVVSGAIGQFPNSENKVFVYDNSVLGHVVLANGGLQWYNSGGSTSLVPSAPSNMRGLTQISGSSTSATVTLPYSEPDTNYFVYVTVAGVASGSPSSGSFVVTGVTKTTTSFTFNVSAAPAGLAVVNYNWLIVR